MIVDAHVNLMRWYVAAAIAPGVAALYYLRSLIAAYASMPERVPVHFDLHGSPDGWMNRGLWPVISLAVLAGLGGLLFTTRPGPWHVPTLMFWGVYGLLAGAFSAVNAAAVSGTRFQFRPMLVGLVLVLGGGIVISLALAGWWRVPR